jgi:hypothetical protein
MANLELLRVCALRARERSSSSLTSINACTVATNKDAGARNSWLPKPAALARPNHTRPAPVSYCVVCALRGRHPENKEQVGHLLRVCQATRLI